MKQKILRKALRSIIKPFTPAVEAKDHSADWETNVGKYLNDKTARYFYEQSDDSYMSPNMADMNTKLLGIYFIELNNGMEDDFYAG